MEASTNEIPLGDIQPKTKMNAKEVARQKEYRIKNREKELASRKEYYIKNKEKVLASRKEYDAKNREKINANRMKRYYQNKKIKPVEDFDPQTHIRFIEVSDTQTSICPHEIVLSDINKCTICQTREEMLEMGISLMDILEAEKRVHT